MACMLSQPPPEFGFRTRHPPLHNLRHRLAPTFMHAHLQKAVERQAAVFEPARQTSRVVAAVFLHQQL